MKKSVVVFFALILLLSGCKKKDAVPAVVGDVEPSKNYEWMEGESPVPNERIAVSRAGLQDSNYSVSPSGTYFLYFHSWIYDQTPPSPWILYVDHGSDKVVKLCGRPDCSHDTEDCNAHVPGANRIWYYEGYLYVMADETILLEDGQTFEHRYNLWRLNPDGSNHEIIMNLNEFAASVGGITASPEDYIRDRLVINVYGKKEDSATLESEWIGTYLMKYDTGEGPVEVHPKGLNCYMCGNVFLHYQPTSEKGGKYGSYWNWDLETDTMEFLTDHPGEPGWFGEEEAYYVMDGDLHHMVYETGADQVVIDTDLSGDYYGLCLPECIVILENSVQNVQDKNLYFYNWNFQPVGTVEIPYSDDAFLFSDALLAETAERIILTDGGKHRKPCFYINKSELGTGNVKVHTFDLPFLWEDSMCEGIVSTD